MDVGDDGQEGLYTSDKFLVMRSSQFLQILITFFFDDLNEIKECGFDKGILQGRQMDDGEVELVEQR